MTRQASLSTLAAMIFLSACVAPGDRAGSGDFSCPADEVCSPNTPEGLWFSGATFFDQLFDAGPHSIASGGSQTIYVLGSSSSSDYFTDPFVAESTSPLAVEQTNPPNVVLRSDGSGSGYLRILDPDTYELYDRISIDSAPIASIRVVPTEAMWYDPNAAENMDWALLASSSVDLGIVLRSSSDERLVDESLAFSISGDASENGSSGVWDERSVAVGSSGAADVFVSAGSGYTLSDTMPIVPTVDDIVIVESPFGSNTSLSIPAGSERVYCFRGISGNRAVAGLSWSVTVQGPIETKNADASCFGIKATAQGNATMVVLAADHEKAFAIKVTQSASNTPPLQKPTPLGTKPSGPAKGQRGA